MDIEASQARAVEEGVPDEPGKIDDERKVGRIRYEFFQQERFARGV